MSKLVLKYDNIKDTIITAVDTITDPVRQTMGPKGNNCIYEDNKGNQFVTNDGVTIAKHISVKDPVQNAIIEIIKGSALKTNAEAGDGTSSTILLSSILIKEGLKLVDAGHNRQDIKKIYLDFAEKIKGEIKKSVINITNDEELFNIATISANSDKEIAKDVVETIKVVGEEGQVILNPGYSTKTEIIKDTGFVFKQGIIKELAGPNGVAMYENIPVLITDKRLYYSQEAETILTTLLENGYEEAVIIASDFIGEALPYFVANHQQGKIKILLIKETDLNTLEDMAKYLHGKVISDKSGNIVNNISIGDFAMAAKALSDKNKTIISRYKEEKNTELVNHIKSLRAELKEIGNKADPEYRKLENRIASLTRGMVTLRIGGHTQLEVMEKMFRYEDAINATRSAMSDGYVVGGGLTLLHAFSNLKLNNPEFAKVFKKVCQANISQVAINAGLHPDICLTEIAHVTEEFDSKLWGYNANTGKYEDLLKAGIIEPFKVLSQVINNSISIANIIITSQYLIVNDIEEEKINK